MTYDNLDFFYSIDEIYPTGLINGLSKRKRLYKQAKELSRNMGVTIKVYFENNGYRYIEKPIQTIHKDIKGELLELYPDCIVENLSLNKSLYYKLKKYSDLEEYSLEEYLESLGFYMKSKEDEFYKELIELYPDKNIYKLSAKDKLLYNQIYKRTVALNLDINKYLEHLGFNVIKDIKIISLKDDLIKAYPNKIIKSLSVNNPSLYVRTNNLAKKNSLTTKEFLIKLGFIMK